MNKKDNMEEQTAALIQGILSLQTPEECKAFLEDLCTIAELQSLAQRFEVARLLKRDLTYHEVAKETGASTATISRVSRCLNYGTDGYELVISRLKEKSDS